MNKPSEVEHSRPTSPQCTSCQSPQSNEAIIESTLNNDKIKQTDTICSLENTTSSPLSFLNNSRTSVLPKGFFSQSSPPLPISPLSSFSSQATNTVALSPKSTFCNTTEYHTPLSSGAASPESLSPSPSPVRNQQPQPLPQEQQQQQQQQQQKLQTSVSSPQLFQSSMTTARHGGHRRSISMDRDIRNKLQHMTMTPATPTQQYRNNNDRATAKDGNNGGLGDSLDHSEENDNSHQKLSRRSDSMKKPLGRHKLTLDHFILEKTVGTGSFGRVHLAQSRTSGRFYAIKALRKRELVDRGQVEHANNERVILRSVEHPFVVKLYETFQDESHVFFVMDYVPGGELFRILRRNKKFSEATARFYAAEVLLAIEYLHQSDIAYRDIKPENILLDAHGHIKLADFGFSKKVTDLTWTVCGTPDYLAPEIIRSQGYTKAVDWWSFGVLIYEMVTGNAPFQAVNPVDKYQMILDGNVTYYRESMSNHIVDLLQHLLVVKPTERYGNLREGTSDIKRHPWFNRMDFVKLSLCQVKPPYIPDVKHAGDSSCFQTYSEPNTPYGSILGDNTDDDTNDDDDNDRSSYYLSKNHGSVGDPFSEF